MAESVQIGDEEVVDDFDGHVWVVVAIFGKDGVEVVVVLVALAVELFVELQVLLT